MPVYDFRNENTGEIFEKKMSISEKEAYLKENPHISSVPSLVGFGGVQDLKMKKPDEGFREVMSKISENMTIDRRSKGNLTKF